MLSTLEYAVINGRSLHYKRWVYITDSHLLDVLSVWRQDIYSHYWTCTFGTLGPIIIIGWSSLCLTTVYINDRWSNDAILGSTPNHSFTKERLVPFGEIWRPQAHDTPHWCHGLGCVFRYHCLLCTLGVVIICLWPYYLHCDIDPQCKVLVAMLLLSVKITWIRSVLVGGHALYTLSMGMPASGRLIYKWHMYLDLWLQVLSYPLSDSSLLCLASFFSIIRNRTVWII